MPTDEQLGPSGVLGAWGSRVRTVLGAQGMGLLRQEQEGRV
jgi:hypothetical protein